MIYHNNSVRFICILMSYMINIFLYINNQGRSQKFMTEGPNRLMTEGPNRLCTNNIRGAGYPMLTIIVIIKYRKYYKIILMYHYDDGV